jgi:hypothetical protein
MKLALRPTILAKERYRANTRTTRRGDPLFRDRIDCGASRLGEPTRAPVTGDLDCGQV